MKKNVSFWNMIINNKIHDIMKVFSGFMSRSPARGIRRRGKPDNKGAFSFAIKATSIGTGFTPDVEMTIMISPGTISSFSIKVEA